MTRVSLLRIFFLAILFLSLFCREVYAYLDPGTGSYLLQLLTAAVFGILFAVKIHFRRIKAFLASFVFKEQNGERKK